MGLPIKLPVTALINALDADVPLKKHTATIHIDTDFTATEHKLMNILYKAAFDAHDWDAKFYYVKLSDIKEFLGRTVMDRTDIEKNLDRLLTSKISWNIFEQDKKNRDVWNRLSNVGSSTFIARWDHSIESGCIKFSLTEDIKNMIKNPNIFTYIDLNVQKKLKSKYEIKLYELLVDELNRSRKDETVTRWYNINELYRIFGIPPTSYLNDSRKFNIYCLKSPIKEISEHSDLDIKINNMMKVRNKVVAYNFQIIKKNKDERKDEQIELELSPPSPEESDEYTNEMEYDVFDELTQIFNSTKTATEIINAAKEKYTYFDFEDLIKENIEYAKRSQKSVHNFFGYLRMAIENDYAGYEARFQKAAQEQIEAEERLVKAKQQAEVNQKKMLEAEEYQKQIRQEERKRLSDELGPYLTDMSDIWQNCLKTLESKLSEGTFEMWFRICDQMFMDKDRNAFIIVGHKLAADTMPNFIDSIEEAFIENNVEVASINLITAAQIKAQFL